jgi:hypothetical protein
MMVPARARELVYGVEAREVVLDADVGMQEEDEGDGSRGCTTASRTSSGRGHRVRWHATAWYWACAFWTVACVSWLRARISRFIEEQAT